MTSDEQPKRFWRRQWFPMAPNQRPKWHQISTVDGRGTWTALCGYRFNFVLESPMTKDEVATKKLRCAKCDEVEKKNKARRLAAARKDIKEVLRGSDV